MAPVILSVKEKQGLTAILKKLNTDDLVSLTYTATHGMVKAETRDEAIRIVLTFTEKPAVLLRRRKVKKELIFQYLKEEGVVVSVNGEKMDFVKACLQYWKSDGSEDVNQTLTEELPEEEVFPPSRMAPPPVQNSFATEHTDSRALSPYQEMGQQFALWFFRLLNNSADTSTGPETFGPQHFWQDCSMKVCAEQNGQVIVTDNITGAENVCSYLFKLIAVHQLFFNPNLNDDGVRCHQEYHGLVRIAVGGVVHRCGNCIGLFDQMFGLVLDPNSTCRWRIKDTKLLLKLSRTATCNQFSPLT